MSGLSYPNGSTDVHRRLHLHLPIQV